MRTYLVELEEPDGTWREIYRCASKRRADNERDLAISRHKVARVRAVQIAEPVTTS